MPVSSDRNKLEQEALAAMGRGNLDGALKAYLGILRGDAKDRRIRQKVAELYIKMGKSADAERHLREVAEAILKEGNPRAAVSVLKQLVTLKGDDAQLQIDLAECYIAAGYPNDARQYFDGAMRLYIGVSKPKDASKAARRLADLSPGEPALKLKVAELCEAGGDNDGACGVYVDVMDEYRRRGRLDEVGRIAEMLLRLRPDDVGVLLDAATARIEAQDWKKALAYLQTAFLSAPKEPRTLDLLSRAFEGAGQGEKALKVLLELARVAGDRRDAAAEADALRRASKLAPEDIEVKQRLAEAEDRLSRLERRLTSLVLSQPANEDELRAVVRAEVFSRYGFHDRAEAALNVALEGRGDSLALIASIAEALVAADRVDDALRWMQRIVPRAGNELEAVLDRMAVLRGAPPPSEDEPEPELPSFNVPQTAPPVANLTPAFASPVPSAPAPPIVPIITSGSADETHEERGDRLAAAADLVGAIGAYRQALGEDPTDENVLAKIAALRSGARAPAPPPEPPPPPRPSLSRPTMRTPEAKSDAFAKLLSDEGTFAEVSPDALDEVEPESAIDEARSLVAVGLWDDAIRLVGDDASLLGRVVHAQALKGTGDAGRAMDVLRDATNNAAESDPGYDEALFDLSALYAVTGKHKAALRLLEELIDLNPEYRASEVEARLRGLQKLLK